MVGGQVRPWLGEAREVTVGPAELLEVCLLGERLSGGITAKPPQGSPSASVLPQRDIYVQKTPNTEAPHISPLQLKH